MNRRESIKNIVFDLGGVLIDWNPSRIVERAGCSESERRAALTVMFRHEHWVRFDRGEIAGSAAIRYFSEVTGISRAGVKRLLEAYEASLTAIPESVRWLESLDGRGVPLYCLSNCSSEIYDALSRRYPFFGCFRGVAISGITGHAKPEPGAFIDLLASCKLTARDCVLIDDRAENVEAARGVGMQAIRFRSPADCRIAVEAMLSDAKRTGPGRGVPALPPEGE